MLKDMIEWAAKSSKRHDTRDKKDQYDFGRE